MLEGLRVGGVVHDDDAVRAAVVAARDRAEALLPRRVPNLQLDRLAVHHDGLEPEVDADRRDVGLRELVVGKSCEGVEAGAAVARVLEPFFHFPTHD